MDRQEKCESELQTWKGELYFLMLLTQRTEFRTKNQKAPTEDQNGEQPQRQLHEGSSDVNTTTAAPQTTTSN